MNDPAEQIAALKEKLAATGWDMTEERVHQLGSDVWEVRGVADGKTAITRNVNRLDAWNDVARQIKLLDYTVDLPEELR
jgi:hypothetical protein